MESVPANLAVLGLSGERLSDADEVWGMSISATILAMAASFASVAGYDCAYDNFRTPAKDSPKIAIPNSYGSLPFLKIRFSNKNRKSIIVTEATDWFLIKGARDIKFDHRIFKKNKFEAIDYYFNGDENSECSLSLNNCLSTVAKVTIADTSNEMDVFSFIFTPRIELIPIEGNDKTSYRAIGFFGRCKRVYSK